MWWKLLIGLVLGLIVGNYVAPGYWLWALIGLILGYLADLCTKRRASGKKN